MELPAFGYVCVHDQPLAGGVVPTEWIETRLLGTARDLVIGMQFATVAGKLVQSGGMVVKNVAGLDMGKLMIGSWGTLGAIAAACWAPCSRWCSRSRCRCSTPRWGCGSGPPCSRWL